jgi:hypothetical protein
MFTQTFSLNPIEPVNIFSFVSTRNPAFDQALIYALYLLGLTGLISCGWLLNHRFSQFILIMTAGFLLSMPLAPTYQTSFMRYYAASMPLLGLIPAYGLFGIQIWAAGKWDFLRPVSEKKPENLWHYGFIPSALTVAAILLPVFLPKSAALTTSSLECPQGLTPVIFPFYKGSQVTVLRQDFKNRGWVPLIYDDKFLRDVHNIPQKDMMRYLEKLDFPVSIFPTVNLLNNKTLFVISNHDLGNIQPGILYACGLIEDEQNQVSESGFFIPKSDFILAP